MAAATTAGMGHRLRADKPLQYFTKPPRPTQPPALSEAGNEYQPKCGDICGWGLRQLWFIPLVDNHVGSR